MRTRVSLVMAVVVSLLIQLGGLAPVTAAQRGQKADKPILSAMIGGNTNGALLREAKPRKDGFRHIDTAKTIARLKALHANHYTYGVWDSSTDWDDLRLEFAPAARKAGIDIWVYLVPPTECFRNSRKHLRGNCSEPYDLDFVRWSAEIAKLSLKHPNIKAWAIDDFLSGQVNRDLFTDQYLAKVRASQEAINPALKFYVTLYFGEIVPKNLDIIKDSLDGVIYPYLGFDSNTNDTKWVTRRVDAALAQVKPYDLDLVFLPYTGRFLDTVLDPREDTVAEILRQVRPYVLDGRIRGIISYAAPIAIEDQFPSHADRSYDGGGRLSLSINSNGAGRYAEGRQKVRVDRLARTKTLTFRHRDRLGAESPSGRLFKQVLIDGKVAWEQDVSDGSADAWQETKVDLTRALAGRTSAEVSLRFEQRGTDWLGPLDVSFDTVRGTGLTVADPSFDTRSKWQLKTNNDGMRAYVDLYHADTFSRIFNAIGAEYAAIQGQRYSPVRPPVGSQQAWSRLVTGAKNQAFNGNGRLSFSQPANTTSAAGTCATAWQDVAVTPGLPRYEISFWHGDPHFSGGEHIQHKELYLGGKEVWKRSTRDFWPWYYIYGSDHQGAIEVTDFVAGQKKVRLELKMCTDKPWTGLDMDASFDNIQTVGLTVANPDFENRSGWHLASQAPIKATIPLARR